MQCSKYKQRKAAMDLNISREALSHYENGRRDPSLAMLILLSDYFHVSIDYLFRGVESPLPTSGDLKCNQKAGRMARFL